MISHYEASQRLASLDGRRLVAVTFTSRLMELQFDISTRLEIHDWPLLLHEGSSISYGDDRYIDAICSAIATNVQKTSIDSIGTLECSFEIGLRVRLPIRSDDGHETCATLTGDDDISYAF